MSDIPHESRYYHFRINDMSDEQYNYILSCKKVDWLYIGVIENDEKAKGRHYHVAVKFSHAVTKSVAIKRLLFNQKLHTSQYYIEAKYKSAEVKDFIKYCIKNGLRAEIGKGPLSENVREQTDEDAAQAAIANTKQNKQQEDAELFDKRWAAAQRGDIEWFMENDRKFMMTNSFGKLMTNAQPDITENLENLDNYYIYGNPGLGKSSSVDYLFPTCYRKIKNNEKWDSYFTKREGHQVVYFDELDSLEDLEMCMGGVSGLKEKSDVYPFPVRQNYGNRQLMIRPKTMIITSNFTPSQLFVMPNKYGRHIPNVEMLIRAFTRRWKVMHISEWLAMNKLVFNQQKKRIQHEVDFFNEIHEEMKINEDVD